MVDKPARRLATDEEMVLLEIEHERFIGCTGRTEGNILLYINATMDGVDPVTASEAVNDFIVTTRLSCRRNPTPLTPFMVERFRAFATERMEKKEYHNG